MNEAAKVLTGLGWNVEVGQSVPLHLPPEINARFLQLPTEYIQFLEQVRCCVNAAGTAWFLTQNDFAGTSDSAFLWNEFEVLSLDAAQDDSDLARSITRFWDWHLPIALSTKSGYAFLALSLAEASYGQIVLGREPEFEDVEAVCDSFDGLLTLLKMTAVSDHQALLSDFI